ncbi:glycosyltransferase [Rhodohalobacter sp. 8-1]|uniref:glycosyltransferase n=1 Tax=Rhodohalobacter sp. 8-1 TaxID=3131972 RepID=UPI0030EB8BBC
MRYSVIVPVYNRPEEINELLKSLTDVSYKSFEVLIIEDGSTDTCGHIVDQFKGILDIHYYQKENTGQGFSRNFGFERAKGDYLVVFDSDCLIPAHYFEAVNEQINKFKKIDCWGGPDRAHESFTPIQKAINYSMTSLFTTGGTRGNKRHIGTYHPRSFNMGISRDVYLATGGYLITRMGEDLEFSIRIQKKGFKTYYIDDAYVYHKRRTNFIQFYKQLFFFGRARVNIWRFHPEELKAVHLFPLMFALGLIYSVAGSVLGLPFGESVLYLYGFFLMILAVDAFRQENSLVVGLYSSLAGMIQLTAYGLGFLRELIRFQK